MLCTSNNTIKNFENIIPKHINNQSVPTDVLCIIHEYIPELNDNNIHIVVKYYLSKNNNIKQKVIKRYGPINNWDVSRVTNMSKLFLEKWNFNENISKWNVSNVTNMNYMFVGAKSFNQPLNNWNVSKVIRINNMFYRAKSFNKPLNKWNISNVRDMCAMFEKT